MQSLIISIRLTVVTLLICVAGYTSLILGIAKVFASDTAEGSLITASDGKVIGGPDRAEIHATSLLLAATLGGRKRRLRRDQRRRQRQSPTSTDLTDRAKLLVEQYGATVEKPLPAELAAASGGGLDPHITEHAALYQVERVAKARSIPPAQVESLIKQRAFAPGGAFTPDRLINVLELNLTLDAAVNITHTVSAGK